MRAKMLIVVLGLALAAGGCEESMVSPEQVQLLGAEVQTLNTKLDTYQNAQNEILNTLQGHQIIDSNTVANINKISSEIDRVQTHVSGIATAIQQTPLSGDTAADWLAVLQTVNTASTPFNPYAVPISAGLALAGVIFGFIERSVAKKNGLKYQAHKQAVEKTVVNSTDKHIAAELYNNIGEARANLGVK